MDNAVEKAIATIRREMQMLAGYFAEADAALAKAEAHVEGHAKHAKLLGHIRKARVWTTELARATVEQAAAILGPGSDA